MIYQILIQIEVLNTKFLLMSLRVVLPSSHLHNACIFGCIVYVHLPKQSRINLEARVVKCVFLGYGGNKKGIGRLKLN